MAAASAETRGAVFTRREVVDFILDLAGYKADAPLADRRLLEPSFGAGDFLLPAVERLLHSYSSRGGTNPGLDLIDSIRAVELHAASVEATGRALEALLVRLGASAADARRLRGAWLIAGDYLLTDLGDGFDYVVGNPPYVRQEMIAGALMAEYRRRYRTIYDRADIYVPFIERSLTLLRPHGVLGFICADRWMKNRYGRPLREFVANGFHLRAFVDMVDTPAFGSDVLAYPGIFVIAHEQGGETRTARRPEVSVPALSKLARELTGTGGEPNAAGVHAAHVVRGGDPWVIDATPAIDLVRALEARWPTLEEAGCRVGIGVATGADKAFIAPLDRLDVEPDRKLPLVMTGDIQGGEIVWRGQGVINPFGEDGKLVPLDAYPRLKRYLEARRPEIAGRHVAQKTPANWYRTIDRIYPELTRTPKLLIPDIKGAANIVHDEGAFYPHHNLYHMTSDSWDLRALQAVLLSRVTHLFIASYSTKMKGGFLRFQAQYLRRLRLPRWTDVPAEVRAALVDAARRRDRCACDAAAADLYELTARERASLESAATWG